MIARYSSSVRRRVLGGCELHHFAFGDDGCRIRQDAKHGQRADVDQHAECLAQQEVADQDACLVAPDHARGLFAPSRIAFIDDVVVKQRCGVHELDGGRDAHLLAAFVADQLGGRDSEHRAQPLAARIDQVVGQFRDHIDIGDRLVENEPVDGCHVLGDKIQQRLKVAGRIMRGLT